MTAFAYPYFSGFRDEKGRGEGRGYNINFPLAENITGEQYRNVLEKASKLRDFQKNGKMLGKLGFPILIVQEGGYNTRVIGSNVRHFFIGLWEGTYT